MATSDAPASFEAALLELEEIVATMEGGQLSLQESLTAYKRGAVLLHFCQGVLQDAQQQVEVLEKGVLRALAPAAADSVADDNGACPWGHPRAVAVLVRYAPEPYRIGPGTHAPADR